MSVTVEELEATEELLARYFTDMRVLSIWKASIRSRREHKTRLELRIESGRAVHYTDNVKSPSLSMASPSNRQPAKGLDACIDRAEEMYDKLLEELQSVELDIITTDENIGKIERKNLLISEVVRMLSSEAKKLLELKFRDDKSFEDIGYELRKSRSSVHDFYKKIIRDICKWIKYVNDTELIKISGQNPDENRTKSGQNPDDIRTNFMLY